jgi:ferredoxin--NADP+ reductase
MSASVGSSSRALRVAVVGSGPSGFYAAEPLLNSGINVKVDMFDRLPAPYGLVRYGVAPDHGKIKRVISIYEKIATHPNFSFFGNVCVGEDITINELWHYYDAILIATGAEADRKLGIPGEDLVDSHTATEFVAWYNGHPDYQNRHFDLKHDIAIIVGQGNVAVDVCRILAKTADELKKTDITRTALSVLAESKIKEIHMFGRRGPAQAAFTPIEIREFAELENCDTIIDPKELELSENSLAELKDPANAPKKKNYEILQKLAAQGDRGKSRKLFIHFLRSPLEILGVGKVEKVIFERNKLVGEANKQKSMGTRERETFDCGIFFRSVGYRGSALKGVPFNEQWGIIPNTGGRVADSEHIFTGLYVTGWIKRGPSGIIGTNKPDSEETVKNLLEDVKNLKPCELPDTDAVIEKLRDKEIRVISFADWKKIDAAEIKRGEKEGKPREKFVTVEGMLTVL